MKFYIKSVIVLILTFNFFNSFASNIANPLIPIPQGRMGIGLSYHAGGYTITDYKTPTIFNRIFGRISISPVQYFNLGIDLGTTQIEVAEEKSLNISTFHGKYQFSGGLNIKLSTPFIKGVVGFIAIAEATYFKSENKYNAYYGGFDGNGVIGPIFHIKNVGYIAFGPMLYYIQGKNQSYNSSETNDYSNVNNLRGWLAIEIFPPVKSESSKNYIPYITFEISLTPEAGIRKRAPIQEISISAALGGITKRIFKKEEENPDWHP